MIRSSDKGSSEAATSQWLQLMINRHFLPRKGEITRVLAGVEEAEEAGGVTDEGMEDEDGRLFGSKSLEEMEVVVRELLKNDQMMRLPIQFMG